MKVNGVEVIEIVKTKIPEDKVFKVIYKDKKVLKKTIIAEFRMVATNNRKMWAYIVEDENFMDHLEDYINIFSKIHEKIHEYLIRHHEYMISPFIITPSHNIMMPTQH